MAGTKWTQAEDDDLRELYPLVSNADIALILNERHGNGRNSNGVGLRALVLGVRKSPDYKRTPPRPFWSDERIEWFMAFVPGHTEPEISAEHERIFGTPLTESQIGNAKAKLGVKSGTHGGRFKAGQAAHNKGKTWDEMGISHETQARMRESCFKKGEVHDRPDGWIKPIGYERVDKDGYIVVKVLDSAIHGVQPKEPGKFNRNYRFKHHVVWEEANGMPVPPKTMIVFADHDNRNFDPDNLVAVPRSVWSVINTLKVPYWNRESLEAAMNSAKLSSARRAAMRRVKEERKKHDTDTVAVEVPADSRAARVLRPAPKAAQRGVRGDKGQRRGRW